MKKDIHSISRLMSCALGILIYLSLSAVSSAQTGQISGRVTDAVQAVVVGAEVRVINQATNVERKVKTNNDGLYTVPFVSPGTYQIVVQGQGFSTATSEPVTVTVGQVLVFDVQMKIGAEQQEVTVNASDTEINTTSGSVSTVIDRQFVENLPLNGRSFQSLLYITPGVNLNVGGGNSGSEGTAGQFIVNGQRADANYWMVDGVGANTGISAGNPGAGMSAAVGGSNAVGGTSALVSVDALQEFRIETSSYSPEFGRVMGGQISILTRSGTNQYHGAAFDYLRNGDLDAKDWFADNYGLPKSAEIQNDFGGVLGGPIRKDKTFFFLSAESLHLIQPATELSTVPDMAIRKAAIPSFQPFVNTYPLPQPGAPDVSPGLALYTASFSNPATANAYSLRIDQQLPGSVNLFARYSHAPSITKVRGAGQAANFFITNDFASKSATVGATWAPSSQIVNDARFNYSVGGGVLNFGTDDFGGGLPLNFNNVIPGSLGSQAATYYLIPDFGTNMFTGQGLQSKNYQHQANIVDTLSVQRGAHGLKFGVDYLRLAPSWFDTIEYVPFFPAISSFETGITSLFAVAHYTHGVFLFRDLSLFGQDTWHINSRLNLTYGLRWEINYAPEAESGPNIPSLTGFSLTSLSNLALGALNGPPFHTHYGNVAPRIGGAYRISTDPNWGLVLRAGFGVFYGLATTEIGNSDIGNATFPFASSALYPNSPFPEPVTESEPLPITPPNIKNGDTLAGFDPNLNLPYALEWNFSLEQSLGRAQTFSLSYVGASDKRTLESESIVNPNPNYAAAYLVAGTGSLNFDALQARFQRRLTNGLQALVSYSWSHVIDTGSYGNYSNGGFANVNANRGSSDYDLRNVFTTAITYNVPEWKNNLFTRALTGGWSTDDVVQVRSGPPVDIQDANFNSIVTALGTATAIIRPDIVQGQPRYLSGSQYPGRKAINPAYFTDPPVDPTTGAPTRQGDLGRNAFRAFGLKQWDFAVHREFPIFERLKLQFRAELFNIVNHPNFGPFNNTFQTGNAFFGQATQMLNESVGGTAGFGGQNPLYTPGGPRSGELALKLVF